MKLRQKIFFAFIGSCLVVGGVTEAIYYIKNKSIERDVKEVIGTSISESKKINKMSSILQNLQISYQELMAKESILIITEKQEAKEKAVLAKKEIKQQLQTFKNELSFVINSAEISVRLAEEREEKLERQKKLKTLERLDAQFYSHKKLVAHYVVLSNTKFNEANDFLEETLEPDFRNKLLPLLQEYEADTELELTNEAREIEEAIDSGIKELNISLGAALIFGIFFGSIISHSISKPIIKLKEVTVQIEQGKLDRRVNIKLKDEIGILADSFNKMLDKLSMTTVSKSYVNKIISSMVDSLIVVNDNATITIVNQATLKILGYKENELIGKHSEVIFAAKELSERLKIDRLIKKGFVGNVETTYLKKDGSKILVSFSASVMRDDNGKIQGIVCVAQDITERKRTEEALRESEERYALAARGANDGLWDWNLKTNEVYFSTRWKSMLGCKENDIGKSLEEWFNRVHPDDVEQVMAAIAAHLEGLTPHFENEHRMLHKGGTYRWMLSRGLGVRDADGKAYRIAGSQTDINERKVIEAKLLHEAFHDALTGLPNRVLFMERLSNAISRAKRRGDYLFAVLFLDIDRFKVVNDSLGHTTGDQLLVAIARKLQACLRSGDTVARLGGDEFTILLENIQDVSDATHIADRIQKELSLPFNLSGNEVFTAASIGIALSTTDYDRPEDLLRDADVTMYRAKTQGKARYEVFDQTMHNQAMALLRLETDLRRAIEREEFRVYYQPIVALKSGRITGFEALVRWQHPERGLISPAEFIPVAEETGLIVPIGWLVLRSACRQMHAWHLQFPDSEPLTISVNLSGKQFLQPDMVEQINTILQETGFDARSLKLEITESVLVENAESAAAMLLQLQAKGIRFSIDDFGTGYSSLSYLHRFPIDTLKIDRSFINNVDVDAEKMQIIRTIVGLAWNLGMDVVAEGVETNKQMYQLKALNCEFGQGYFFSKPLDTEAASALIVAERINITI